MLPNNEATPNNEDKGKKALGIVHHGFLIGSIIGTLVFTGGGWCLEWWIIQHQKAIPWEYASATFAVGVVTNLAVVCLIYWTLSERIFKDLKALENEDDRDTLAKTLAAALKDAYASSQKELESKLVGAVQETFDYWKESRVEEFSLINQPRWAEWIGKATKIEICVQGWEDWVQSHSDSWAQFFNRGGTVILFLPDPTDNDILRIVKDRLPDRDLPAVKAEIMNTYRNLNNIRTSVASGTITHYQLLKINWYCAVRFDVDLLVLSPYEHMRVQQQAPNGTGTAEPHVKSPSYKVPLKEEAHRHTAEWIQKEFEGLALPECSQLIPHPSVGWDVAE